MTYFYMIGTWLLNGKSSTFNADFNLDLAFALL